jgi:RalA-binding protein 1
VRLAAAGMETVGHVRKIPNSSSAVGLGIQADQPPSTVARRNSDREEQKPTVTQAPHTEPIAQSSRHSPSITPLIISPPTASQPTLLPSAMPSKLRHESRIQFPPEVSSFMTFGDSPKEATHTIPALPTSNSANTLSPSSQYSSYSPSPVASEKETSSGLSVPNSSRQLAVMTEEDEGDETSHLAPPRVSSLKSPSMESTSTHSSFHSAAQSPPMQRRNDDMPRASTDTETQVAFTNREIPYPNRETPRSTPDTQSRPSISDSTIPEPRHIEMTSPLLPHARITVPETTIYLNPLNREVLCFIVSITVKEPNTEPITWTVAKLLSAFIDLDSKLKTSSRKSSKEWRHMTAPLPDGKTWKDFAPAKISQRKSALEAYLKSLQMAPLSDKSDLCVFLSTHVVQPKEAAVRKEGYLAKKNNIFGSYKTRYFVLNGPVLEYFETVSSSRLQWLTRLTSSAAVPHSVRSQSLALKSASRAD